MRLITTIKPAATAKVPPITTKRVGIDENVFSRGGEGLPVWFGLSGFVIISDGDGETRVELFH